MPVLISVKSGPYLGPWTNVVIDLRVEIALHDIFLVVPVVCMLDGVGHWGPAANCGGRGGAVPIRGGQYVTRSGRVG